MNAFMYGFLDELEKTAGLGRALKLQGAKARRGFREFSEGISRAKRGRGEISGPEAAIGRGAPIFGGKRSALSKARFAMGAGDVARMGGTLAGAASRGLSKLRGK